jgi:hypothetical protein
VAQGILLPVSASTPNTRQLGHGYARIMAYFSRPFVRRSAEVHRFDSLIVYADRVKLKLAFDDYPDTSFVWRYPDLTKYAT